jgi:hypothetical protein
MKLSKSFAVILVLALVSLCHGQSKTPAQTQTPTASVEVEKARKKIAKISPEKLADIQKLLDLVGTRKLVEQTMNESTKQMRPALVSALPPGAYRDKLIDLFIAKFKEKFDSNELLELTIPAYDKHFSHEEINGLIAFYQTPLGQKSQSVLPQLMQELQQAGASMGEQLGRSSMAEVLTEHPELAKQMETAGKATQGK